MTSIINHANPDQYHYDGAGRLTSASVTYPSAPYVMTAHTYAYSFGPTGCGVANAGLNSDRTSGTVDGATTTYCYDGADALTSSSDPTLGTPVYDPHGNTTTLGSQALTYDVANVTWPPRPRAPR